MLKLKRLHRALLLGGIASALACSPDVPVSPSPSSTSNLATAQADGSREVLVRLAIGVPIERVNARYGTRTLDSIPVERIYLLGVPPEGSADDIIADMVGDPDITSASPNHALEAPEAGGGSSMAFADPSTKPAAVRDQNALQRIRVPLAQQLAKGRGVLVAVLDTGIDAGHPALRGKIASGGADLVDGDSNPTDVRDGTDSDRDGRVDEAYGHGTFIAALVLAVAPEARVLPIRFLDSDGIGTAFNAARAVHLAEKAGADVINMSFGIGEESDVLEELIEENHDDDGEIAFAASAGNKSTSIPQHPAAAEEDVLGVAATDPNDRRAPFSNYGGWVSVAAPGVGLLSAFPGGRYGRWSGTSFASALVSGVAALVRSAVVGEEPDVVHRVIIETAVRLSDPRLSTTGRVDARAAVERILALGGAGDGGDGEEEDD